MGEDRFQQFLASLREKAELKQSTPPESPAIKTEQQPSTCPKKCRKTPPWKRFKLRVKLLPVEENDSDTVELSDEDRSCV